MIFIYADESKGSKGIKAAPNNLSKWKSILKSIAEQVSQVDLHFSVMLYKRVIVAC